MLLEQSVTDMSKTVTSPITLSNIDFFFLLTKHQTILGYLTGVTKSDLSILEGCLCVCLSAKSSWWLEKRSRRTFFLTVNYYLPAMSHCTVDFVSPFVMSMKKSAGLLKGSI